MKKWHLVIDVEKCEDCNNCFLACKDEYVGNEWPGYSAKQPLHGQRWINIMRKERGQYPLIDVAYLPTLCMHCDNAPCVASSCGACYKRDDGIVLIDPVKAKGHKEIVESCPYHAIWWNEEEQLPQKCTMCAHLLGNNWEKTRCVQACPTGALRLEHIDDGQMQSIIERAQLETLRPDLKTQPRIYYKNLYRYLKCFIAGSICTEKDGQEDCLEGAEIALYKEKEKINATTTDCFGDFRFDCLEPDSGQYFIKISCPGYLADEVALEVKTSINIGKITLKKPIE